MTTKNQLSSVLPKYIPNTSVTPDIAGSAGANGAESDAVFLEYLASPVATVTGTPGSGGAYTTMTPLWGSIPPSSGNTYYAAVNQALGATLKIQPSDGNNYGSGSPPLRGERVPIPTAWIVSPDVQHRCV